MDEQKTWKRFKDACEKQGNRPNTVIRNFIEEYSNQILDEIPLEQRLAKAMVEAKKIAEGKTQGKNARQLLFEIGE